MEIVQSVSVLLRGLSVGNVFQREGRTYMVQETTGTGEPETVAIELETGARCTMPVDQEVVSFPYAKLLLGASVDRVHPRLAVCRSDDETQSKRS